MVGRAEELAQVRAALVGACARTGRLVLVSGAAGIGKSTLVSAVTAMAGEYAVPVAAGYAIDDAGMPPLWPWRRIARDVPGLVPVLSPNAGTSTDSAVARFTMFADACQVLADAAADRGLLVVLEDLQWADRSSLLLLRHLAGELARTRILVVATYRDTGSAELSELLPDLLRAEETRSTGLTGLTPTDLAHWLRLLSHDDPDAQADRVWARTAGNPLFVRLLLDRGTDAGSAELHQLVLAQLTGLDTEVRDLLDAASVLGERIEPSLLAEVTGQPAAQVDARLDQAVAHGVLVSTPDTAGLSFAHALVRDAVYEQLAPSRRTAVHEQAAIALERSPRPPAALVANHWRRSGAPGWAAHCLRWARLASRSATALLAYDEAARFAALARHAAEADGRDAGVRAELTVEVAAAEFVAGRVDASLVSCQAAARLAQEAGRPDLIAAAALVITGMGDPELTQAVDQLCANAIRAVPADDATLHARLRARQAMAASEVDEPVRARELSAEALALAERDGDPDALLDCLHARHLSLCAPQFLAERRAVAARACALAHRAQQPMAELWGHVWLVDAAFQAGDLAAVDQELGRIEQVAAKGEHAIAWWHLHRLRATRAALIGKLDKAVEYNEAARAVAERIGAISTIGMSSSFLEQLALLRGTIDRDLGETIMAALQAVPHVALVRIFIPLTHALLGETDLARATFAEFRHMPARLQPGPRWSVLLVHIGIVACMLDDVETAERVHHELAGLEPTYMCDGSGAAFSGGSLQRITADLALVTGRVDEAIERYTDAVEMNARIGARPFTALSRLGLAKALLAKGERSELSTARELVTAAAAEFRRLDLPGPLASADATLAAVDAAARASNPLSPRELEVVARIVQAKSNREIAQELVLSERTVETHVRNILAKLGCASRTEIAAWSSRTP
ncbi:ATP-binding protein [Labedaea rhizosphaerae]|uniref:AAA ATPase-like protein n=1 Tax=Labedaea rhizosphaerae TaxID=598644 RepID=A0A4R6S033_LABRH|nr:LuxR family transcriptional regulator [Labedaea rhizosphaerae]TDP92790.1 AAA ATPase-like protein [Labedaea rhizosphaerae]